MMNIRKGVIELIIENVSNCNNNIRNKLINHVTIKISDQSPRFIKIKSQISSNRGAISKPRDESFPSKLNPPSI